MNSTTRLSALLLVSLLLAACGGGGGGGSGGSNPPSNPPSSNNPDPTPPEEPEEPEVPEEPEEPEEPEPEPEPKVGFDLYKQNIEEMVTGVLLLDRLGKSDVKRIPEFVADQVTTHGPTPMCNEYEPCPTPPYIVTTPAGDEITVFQWIDFDDDGVFDVVGEQLVFSYTDFQGLTGGSMGVFDEEREFWAFTFGQRYDDPTHGFYGVGVEGTWSIQYDGILFMRELGDGRIRIGDFEFAIDDEPVSTHMFKRFYETEQGIAFDSLDAFVTIDTNIADQNAIDVTMEWIPFVVPITDEVPTYKLESIETLDFGTVNGKLVLEAGSFQYTATSHEGDLMTAVRIEVDADPAYLAWELDEDGDGTFELTGRVAQSEFQFLLP